MGEDWFSTGNMFGTIVLVDSASPKDRTFGLATLKSPQGRFDLEDPS